MTHRLIILTLAVLGLAACGGSEIAAPEDRGVCYAAARMGDEPVRFNVVARDITSIELCAKELEMMRRRFQSMGASSGDLDGAYQGNFLFLRREGIFTSQAADGGRFLLLVRVGDQLVAPGAISQ